MKHKIVMQQLPCGWTNPEANMVLGPGAVISPEILDRELALATRFFPDMPTRVWIDERATILTTDDAEEEGHTDGILHERIGSTGEGVGAARHKKLDRVLSRLTIARQMTLWAHPVNVVNTTPKMRQWIENGHNVLLEGTQGYGLSMHLGHWPYVTTSNCTAQQMASDAGVPRVDEVIMVVRTYPIRVAGNSGPLAGEITWEDVSRRAGRNISERTTVTKKVRRVGTFDVQQVLDAAFVNGATGVVLTFGDYLGPHNEYVTELDRMTSEAREWVTALQSQLNEIGLPILAVGTGFSLDKGWTYIDLGWDDFKRYNLR
jgi:adenylosuccinate synthase